MHLLDIFTIVFAGLLAGNELTVSLFINPVMRKLDATAQTRAQSLFAGLLGWVMPFWYILCLVLFAAETFVHRGRAVFSLLLAATILWVFIIVMSIFALVPIAKRIAALREDAPLERWLPESTRWERLHRVRIALVLVSWILVIYSLLVS
ncbi:anthrone oxygenase family protein [Edaphobacter albus]|uniref:anthrone oxygenase family protein n=1 Tax=Edaphobacter sp. 4G125 TaxID=2763071 RepID=UPI0016486BF1|nr:DUF1772 domain-containing protein [Edaphobacter sp. 4G125]QNI37313.1 DUF1772 domain-containing protein [Edaphobacter sp. 4G125]